MLAQPAIGAFGAVSVAVRPRQMDDLDAHLDELLQERLPRVPSQKEGERTDVQLGKGQGRLVRTTWEDGLVPMQGALVAWADGYDLFSLDAWAPAASGDAFVAETDALAAYTINNTIGVSTVVYCGYSALSIPASIIEELKSRADSDGEMPVAGKNKPEFAGKIGDKIKFKPDIPLAGLIWEIKGVDNTGNLVVELENQLGSGYRITSDPSKVGDILTGDHTSRPFEPIDGEEAISPQWR